MLLTLIRFPAGGEQMPYPTTTELGANVNNPHSKRLWIKYLFTEGVFLRRL